MGSESTDHSSYDMNDDILIQEGRRLRRHLGLGHDPVDLLFDRPKVEPLFFIERAPDSRNGARCKLPTCVGRIDPGELRLALNPSMGHGSWYRNSASKRRLAGYFNDSNLIYRKLLKMCDRLCTVCKF